MGKVIAFANNKGGVGKTTSCASLGYGLVNKGKRVLLIDADPVGGLTTMMGIDKDTLTETAFSVLKRIVKKEDFEKTLGINNINGIDILPTDTDLSNFEDILPVMGKENIFKRYLSKIKEDYDYILIDCQGTINMLVINSLVASDSVVIPVKADLLSYEGTALIFDLINQIVDPVDGINQNLSIAGVLLAIAKKRTRSFREFKEQFIKDCGEGVYIFESIIPDSIKGSDVSASFKSIYEFDKNGNVSAAYSQFTDEILRRLGGSEHE
jgi:chromosome partitioning protein